MDNKLQKVEELSDGMRAYLREGDLSRLPLAEKDRVLVKMCEHYSLDPILRPFILIKLNGKEVWYPTKSATDQVAAKFNLTREIVEIKENVDRGILECRVRISAEGSNRVETCIAAVPIIEFGRNEKGVIVGKIMAGEAYANALMRVETKAKRRATLGWLGIAEDYDPLENQRAYTEAKTLEAEQIAESDEKEKRRVGRPSRADVEARALAEKEPDRIHLAEQVENVSKLEKADTKTNHETQPRVNGKFAPKPKVIESELEVENEVPTVQVEAPEKELKIENVPLVKPEVVADTKHNGSINYLHYSRQNDSHKHFMRVALESLGLDWTNVEHVKLATKVSIACDGKAPIINKADNQYARTVFVDFVQNEMQKAKADADFIKAEMEKAKTDVPL